MNRDPRKTEPFDDVPLSALLQAARATYSHAVRDAQIRVGCGDLPGTGRYIVSAMHWSGASLESVIRWMGVSKQAVGQAVDLLVVRGYLERSRDTLDRRRVNLTLTARGQKAGKAARSAIEGVDRALQDCVGPRHIAHARATLVALLEMEHTTRGSSVAPGVES